MLLGLLVILCLGIASPVADAEDRATTHKKAMAAARRLIREGRYEDAMDAAGPWSSLLRQDLRTMMEEAAGQEKADELLALHEAYLRYYPFGYLNWHNDWREWGEVACRYAELKQKQQRDPADPRVQQDIAAVGAYRELMECYGKYDHENLARLADEIVEKYPLSHFAPAAVLSAEKRAGERLGGKTGLALYGPGGQGCHHGQRSGNPAPGIGHVPGAPRDDGYPL